MDNKKLTIITAGLAILYAILLIGWHLYDPYRSLATQEPGADNRPEGTARKADDVVIGEFFMDYAQPAPTGYAGIWSGFRGDGRTNITKASAPVQLD